MNCIQKIEETLSTKRPYRIQLAKDHIWETPWIIDTNKNIPSDQEITSFLNSNYKSIQTEMWFRDLEGLTTIFVLGHNSNYLLSDCKEFLQFYFKSVYEYQSFSQIISLLNKKLFGSDYLFSDIPDLARVSIVNYWFSQNPVTVWEKKNSQKPTYESLKLAFQNREDLKKTHLNFQGMACPTDFENKIGYYGIKPQVGAKQGDEYVLETSRIINFLQKVFDI